MADTYNLGKKAEGKVKQWLDMPEQGFCFDRIPDQLSGHIGSSNISDFILFKYPFFYYIECKSTWEDRWDFNTLKVERSNGTTQYSELLKKSSIEHVTCYVIVLYATYKEAFIFNIKDIDALDKQGKKSLNIKKKASWPLPYIQVRTIFSRKQLLDYDPAQASEIFGGSNK